MWPGVSVQYEDSLDRRSILMDLNRLDLVIERSDDFFLQHLLFPIITLPTRINEMKRAQMVRLARDYFGRGHG